MEASNPVFVEWHKPLYHFVVHTNSPM